MAYLQILVRLDSSSQNQSKKMILSEKESWFVYSMYSNRVKFGVQLVLQIFAFIGTLFIFYRCFQNPRQHQKIEFHLIFLLLIISFIFNTMALPFTQIYLFQSYVFPSFDIFCSLWNWFHYSLNIINLFLMAFLSVERHILIFHSKYLQTSRQKYLFHFIPIGFGILYPPIFYGAAIFLCPCENYYDFTQLLCVWPCYFYNPYWAKIDLFFNNYVPLFIIPIFCAILYIRVWCQRRSMRREALKWRRDRRLILQLWLISTLYLGMWMPLQLCSVINMYFDPYFLLQAQIDYMYLFPNLIHLLYPFIVLILIYPKQS